LSDHLKIFGISQSRTARCLWMARELGLEHESVPVHFAKTRESPDLMRVNPNARVPAIDDRGFKLYESMAINLYLVKKYGAGKEIAPKTLEDEALATQWSFWVMTEVEKPLLTIMLHVLGMRPADEATLASSRTELERPLKVIEEHLAEQPYLLGKSFTVADLNVASVMVWSMAGKLDLAAYPRLSDWLKRCLSRPAFKG
jgi:glutathione S-transferase